MVGPRRPDDCRLGLGWNEQRPFQLVAVVWQGWGTGRGPEDAGLFGAGRGVGVAGLEPVLPVRREPERCPVSTSGGRAGRRCVAEDAARPPRDKCFVGRRRVVYAIRAASVDGLAVPSRVDVANQIRSPRRGEVDQKGRDSHGVLSGRRDGGEASQTVEEGPFQQLRQSRKSTNNAAGPGDSATARDLQRAHSACESSPSAGGMAWRPSA